MKADYWTILLILYIAGTMQYDCSSRPMSWKLGYYSLEIKEHLI